MLKIVPPAFSLREYLVDKWCPRKGYKAKIYNIHGDGIVVEVFDVKKAGSWWLGREYVKEEKKVLTYWYYNEADKSWGEYAGKRLFVLMATKPYFDEVSMLGEQLENELEIEGKENMIFYIKCE